jgi:hypothetical protein
MLPSKASARHTPLRTVDLLFRSKWVCFAFLLCFYVSPNAFGQHRGHSGGSHASHSYARSYSGLRSHSGSHSYTSHSHYRISSAHSGSTRSYRSHSGSFSTRATHSYASHSSRYCASCTRSTAGRIARNSEARHEFMRQSGYSRGRPGYVVDQIIPLKGGGADSPSNMQWQTTADAKAKDKTE